MMKTLQNIWKHKREFQINIFMVIGIDKFQFVEQIRADGITHLLFFVTYQMQGSLRIHSSGSVSPAAAAGFHRNY